MTDSTTYFELRLNYTPMSDKSQYISIKSNDYAALSECLNCGFFGGKTFLVVIKECLEACNIIGIGSNLC